jgi:hypothetical protein
MSKGRGVRAIIAGVFVTGMAAAGLGVTAASAGVNGPPPNCEVDGGPNGGPVEIEQNGRAVRCATLQVTKVVTGQPAPGTTFSVVVDCVRNENGDIVVPREVSAQQLPQGNEPPFTKTLTFPETGGAEDVFISRPATCTVSETPPPGCTLTSIDPVTTEVLDDVEYPVTVTNNCDPAAAVVEPAAAVVEAPRFTG